MKLLTTILLMAVATFAFSQTSPGRNVEQLIGNWNISFGDADERARRMIVTAVQAKDGSTFVIRASLGFTGEERTVTSAELVQSGDEQSISIVARSGASIVAKLKEDGRFEGVWTFRGTPTKVVLTKLTDTALTATPAIRLPSPDTPPLCAIFSGGWHGVWPISGFVYLWVVDVDKDCIATYAYAKNTNPSAFKTAKIVDGTLPTANSSGEVYFSGAGAGLSARFVGNGGESFANFRKVK